MHYKVKTPNRNAPVHSRLVKAVRQARQWSQADLARELKVSPRTVKRWESGRDRDRDPAPSRMAELRDLLVAA